MPPFPASARPSGFSRIMRALLGRRCIPIIPRGRYSATASAVVVPVGRAAARSQVRRVAFDRMDHHAHRRVHGELPDRDRPLRRRRHDHADDALVRRRGERGAEGASRRTLRFPPTSCFFTPPGCPAGDDDVARVARRGACACSPVLEGGRGGGGGGGGGASCRVGGRPLLCKRMRCAHHCVLPAPTPRVCHRCSSAGARRVSRRTCCSPRATMTTTVPRGPQRRGRKGAMRRRHPSGTGATTSIWRSGAAGARRH